MHTGDNGAGGVRGVAASLYGYGSSDPPPFFFILRPGRAEERRGEKERAGGRTLTVGSREEM